MSFIFFAKKSETCLAKGQKKGLVVKGRELYSICDDELVAQEIASLYQIELVEYKGHVAVFHTEDDPGSVIEFGSNNSLPRLSLNRKNTRN
ncbi:MAG: hypothetical protein IJF95_05755, partial [Erysipelotrichaceae bacterium]|nr:hypothetical protein [Erysipelotrichaceae bacterium]MBQ6334053.1 hypothetical protein [Erysipelotrichaceae bacterium]